MLHQQEDDLAERFFTTRDPQLREEIILRYVPLVHYVLGRLGFTQSMGADYEDAASHGLLGLIEAADRYNPRHGAQFSTYATLRIRGKVIDYLRSMDWLSRGARKRARTVQAAVSELWETTQRQPTDEEVAAHTGLEVSQIQQALADNSRIIVSLDAMTSATGEDDGALYEMLPDDGQVEPSQQVEEEDTLAILANVLRELPRREQLILSLYYFEELTFKEIGAVLEISESRVCQLHGKILVNLRAVMANPEALSGLRTQTTSGSLAVDKQIRARAYH